MGNVGSPYRNSNSPESLFAAALLIDLVLFVLFLALPVGVRSLHEDDAMAGCFGG